MSFIDDLQNDKDLQNRLLAKLQEHPGLITSAAALVSFIARAVSPFWALYNVFYKKTEKQIITMHKIVRDPLNDKLNKYLDLIKTKSDLDGFIEHDCCDSLLFTSLVGSVGHKVDIEAAIDEMGAWQRRPTHSPCYPEGSKSSISRDMLLGLMWYIWRNNRLDLAEEMWAYGKKHSWIMGVGDPARIYLTPGLQATLAEIIFQLGGSNHWFSRNMPQVWTKGLDGYQLHLEALHILLRGELMGHVTSSMKESIDDMASRYIQNQLFTLAKARFSDDQYSASFNGTLTAVGLQDVDLWPNDRLPTSLDRDSHWLFEDNDLSKGTDPNKIHTGGDLVFCAGLLMNYSDVVD